MYSNKYALSIPQVDNNSIIDFTPTLRASGPSTPLILDNSLLSPGLDYDFTKVSDEGKEFYRGGMRYYRPCGWRRIALNVEGKYQDNAWLGRGAWCPLLIFFSFIMHG